jgi:nicotinamidase-related amidase
MHDTTALLVMDVQRDMVSRYAGDHPDYLARLSRAIAAAREAGVRVIYVTVWFRHGYPEISAGNKWFSTLTATGRLLTGEGAAVASEVAPAPGDVVVTKRRVSAFAGSDLEVLLRAGNVDTLVLSGIATSGVVLSTLREAADRDYRLVVLADGCLDGDAEVHRVLTEKVFPRQADVLTVRQWMDRLAGPQ